MGELLNAINPDTIEQKTLQVAGLSEGSDPGDSARDQVRDQLIGQAASVFNGELVELIDRIRRDK